MKAISLGLIFSIIFSIVLAKNGSDSNSTTGCFSFLKKKTKKSHKTTDEPVKVKGKGVYDPDLPDFKFIDEFDTMLMEIYKENQTELEEPVTSETDDNIVDKVDGFLRRENESKKKGWYIRPYEYEYEDMINEQLDMAYWNAISYLKNGKNNEEEIRRITDLHNFLKAFNKMQAKMKKIEKIEMMTKVRIK
ncbi:erythrocyte membrane antigen 1 [Plasmodium chabaudi chabaudi]|uniref:Erythrocyte membrane antigen 1 n=1 Tax=Plasmodium chabaudi chabaudi TaxID=31271 RepID=A0A1D3L934_PLACU|nr:erythrocyte membrane antigen 1 [Plasmodium chabaudi chabaudi]